MSQELLAVESAGVLEAHGYIALLVGGCVRDRLLSSEPKDYDIATNARPDQILALFPNARLVGAQFGVVMVPGEGGGHIEVATFRSDHSYSDGRHPGRVEFESDPRQDVLRRDFTINALLQNAETGEVFDYVGGQQDLRARIVRAIGNPELRFMEDHLRMLRAIRFAARLDFTIEPDTFSAIRSLAPKIQDISAERVRDELLRILTEGHARQGLELLDRSGLLAEILPEVKAMQGVEQPPQYHPEGDVWNHTLLMMDKLNQPTETLVMGVLLHDVGKPATFRVAERIRFDGHVEAGLDIAKHILSRLKFSRRDCEQILALIENHMRFKDVQRMRDSTLKRFLRLPEFEEHLELHRVDCLSSHGMLDNWRLMREKMQSLSAEELRPARLLTGRDLIAAGFQPGPAFSGALEAVETAQLEGHINSKQEALEVAEKHLTGAAASSSAPGVKAAV
jgi:poly(A) polymerase